MTNMKLKITNFSEFAESIQELNNDFMKLRNLFELEKNNANKLDSPDTWAGASQKAMIEQYKKLNNNYDPILYSLEVYMKFLNKAKEDYTLINEAMTKNLDEFAESLNVNS